MEIINNENQAKEVLRDFSEIALVPTMGNLHSGHVSLVDKAKEVGKTVIASIYVNPLQFGVNEDFDSYPRTLHDDLSKLEQAGCDLVFCPSENILENIQKYKAPDISKKLCGKSRPTHFDGVVTIVRKLFEILNPDYAVFGLKDYQQFLIIKKFFKEHNFQIKILGSPIIREEDGLAMSSRNNLLTPEDRKIAPRIYEQLTSIRNNINNKTHNELIVNSIEAFKEDDIFPEYLSILNPETLEDAGENDASVLIAIAVKLGNVRLIDNILVN
jgi:pantoate--beta-alanine ligase